MTEKLVTVGIPPAFWEEHKQREVKQDWWGMKLNDMAIRSVISCLVADGEIEEGDDIEIDFQADADISPSDYARPVWVSVIHKDKYTNEIYKSDARLYYFSSYRSQNNN